MKNYVLKQIFQRKKNSTQKNFLHVLQHIQQYSSCPLNQSRKKSKPGYVVIPF